MKKTYKNPELKIVNVRTAQLMIASPGYGGSTNAVEGNLSRRRGSDWEDDDEE
ncbi:MAG: hypothetical protein IJP74_13490 [Prevotella sp.]|nr:hypothetical protein [Prevotella sp.]